MSAKEHLKARVFEELIWLCIKCLDAGIESVEKGYIAMIILIIPRCLWGCLLGCLD
jgi:hypothetical protein